MTGVKTISCISSTRVILQRLLKRFQTSYCLSLRNNGIYKDTEVENTKFTLVEQSRELGRYPPSEYPLLEVKLQIKYPFK